MPDTAELRDLNDFTTRPGPALYSMAAAARPSIPSEAEVSPRRRGSSSQTRHIGIRGPVRATADTRALKAASVAVDDLELHRRELTGYCQRIVGASEADDAVQETMLRAWRASADFAGRSSVRAWLYQIAANTCLDLLRGRERRGRLGQRLQASAEVPAVPASSADPAEFAATQDGVRRALAAVLGQLPARQRAALILCEVLRWRSDEAAQVLGTTAAAVASSLQRARATLARQSGLRDPGNVDADQLARYQDAFRRYDIATLVGMIRVEASQAAS
jgi:RNA polymerase sigma-70 factor (ECF subfamily)